MCCDWHYPAVVLDSLTIPCCFWNARIIAKQKGIWYSTWDKKPTGDTTMCVCVLPHQCTQVVQLPHLTSTHREVLAYPVFESKEDPSHWALLLGIHRRHRPLGREWRTAGVWHGGAVGCRQVECLRTWQIRKTPMLLASTISFAVSCRKVAAMITLYQV